MSLRPATAADLPAVESFLRAHEASSIFPLANMAGDGPSAQKLWIAGEAGVEGVIALGASGFLMPQWPGLDAAEVMRALSGQRVAALVGDDAQVTALCAALPEPPRHLSHEPLCTLDLSDLIVPEPNGTHLAPIRPEDAETVIAYRTAFDVETLSAPAESARAKAELDVGRWLRAGTHRLLWQGDRPVALTGLNARLADVVQVGGVFTPPELRGQGHARRAVAWHLVEARAAGARRAALFAANDPALRAYRAIGFAQVGWMGLALLPRPVTLP